MGPHTHKNYPRYNFENHSKWSQKKIVALKQGTPMPQNTNVKPHGLWYSLYSAWVSWGKVTHGQHIHKITFHPNVHMMWQVSQHATRSHPNKIVVLRTFDDVRQFNQRYGVILHNNTTIQWKKVAKQYGGIEFRHYQTIRKHIRENHLTDDYLWYLSIDVSSGCVWNPALVLDIEYVFDKE